ncbi:hypothetical protein H9Q70_014601, partial [Fusarium xylarioides]
PPALDDPAVREERDDRLRATVFRAGRPVRNRSASLLRAPHLSAATHTCEPSVDLSTAPDTGLPACLLVGYFDLAVAVPLVPKSKLKDNIPELNCALTEVKSSAGAAIPYDSEVKLPSNNNTTPKTPYPAKKKNSSAAVTPVKTPKTPKTSHTLKRKLKFPEGEEYAFLCMQCFKGALLGKSLLSCCAVKDKPNLKRYCYCSHGSRKGYASLPCYLLPLAIALRNAIANGVRSEITRARTCALVMFKLFKAYLTLFTISDHYILPSRVFEIPYLGLGALTSDEGSFPGVMDPKALNMIYNGLARLSSIIPINDNDKVKDEDEDIGDNTVI